MRISKHVACVAPLCIMLVVAGPATGQERSVNPGINKTFENPNVGEFVSRFEHDGREAFDQRAPILRECRLKPGMAVADIGAGTGLFTRLFAKEVGPTGKVYAVDIAENFVKHIDETAKSEGLTNVVGVLCAADDVKLPPESVDMAFICDVYHHFEFPEKTMRSLYRALRPGGTVVLIDFKRIPGVTSDFTLSHVRAGQEVFTQEILDAGFRQVEDKKDLLKESYFVRFERPAANGSTR